MLHRTSLGLELAALLASAGPRQGMPLMTWRYYALAVLVPAAIACRLHLGCGYPIRSWRMRS